MKKFFLFMCGLPVMARTLSDFSPETSLYFSLPIQDFVMRQGVHDPMRIYASSHLASPVIDVMTDRPLRKETQTTPQNFVEYVSTRHRPLVYSLSYTQDDVTQTLNFNVSKIWMEDGVLHIVGNLGQKGVNVPAKGQKAVLNVAG